MDRTSVSPTKNPQTKTRKAPIKHKSTQLTPIVSIIVGEKKVDVKVRQLSSGRNIADDYLFIEEFNTEQDGRFLEEVVKPYFANIFSDIAQRRMAPKKANDNEDYVDKVAFFEYTNLPGIITDRFYSTFEGHKDNRITMQSFVDGFSRVYLAPIEEKMKLTFQM